MLQQELIDKILDEYNKNHGSDGRFSSGGSSPSLLTKEDNDIINTAVDKAVSLSADNDDDRVSKIDSLRDGMLRDIGISHEQIVSLKHNTNSWTNNGVGSEGSIRMMAANNLIKGNEIGSGMNMRQSLIFNQLRRISGKFTNQG